jgi:hypothetical protein
VLHDAGARVHLAHPLGVKGFAYRRVKNDARDAADLADLLRMGRLPEAWIAPRRRARVDVACGVGSRAGLALGARPRWADTIASAASFTNTTCGLTRADGFPAPARPAAIPQG